MIIRGLVALGEEQALEELQKNELQNWKKKCVRDRTYCLYGKNAFSWKQ